MTEKPLYMNAGHFHELQMNRIPYGYVYSSEETGANVKLHQQPSDKFLESCDSIAPWLSAALEDPKVCAEYKTAALNFLNELHTFHALKGTDHGTR